VTSAAAFRDEASALTGVLAGLPPPAWTRPTRCAPWLVRDVVGHVIVVLARVPDMIASPAPDRADTTAVGYYRADHRFSDTANAERVQTAQRRAGGPEGASLVRDLVESAQQVIAACEREPVDRVVRTRHGDAMLLSEFLTTRVVELAVHGLDVADALGRKPWLTAASAELLQRLMFGERWRTAVNALKWDPVTLLRRTTGRASVTTSQAAALERQEPRLLTLG
jgi:uncharacterized protein (TIGR03083 family)